MHRFIILTGLVHVTNKCPDHINVTVRAKTNLVHTYFQICHFSALAIRNLIEKDY